MSSPGRRPLPGPPPPHAGADLAIRVARHRRHRTRMIAAGGVVAGAAGAIALTAVGGSTLNLSNDRLDQATTPAVERTNSPRPAPSVPVTLPTPTALPTAAPAATTASQAAPRLPDSTTAPAPAADAAPDGSDDPRAAAYRTPPMTRTTSTERTAPAGTQVCSQHRGDDSSGITSRVNWCVELRVGAAPNAPTLALEVCRDDTGPGTLTYAGAYETDFAIFDRDQREVWRWSDGRSGDGRRQAFDVAAGECVTWSVDWTGVDSAGRRLPAGDYTAVSTTFADELANLPNETRAFSLR